MSGGVRNLRAMFENKDESSIIPPDRGRSPVGSIGGGSSGTSPRPLSKVRTSFVAVERSGQAGTQWGLRRENSSSSNIDPSLATKRESFSAVDESAPKLLAEKNEAIRLEYSERKNSAVVKETIPESAIESPPAESEKKSGHMNGKVLRRKSGSADSKPSANPDKKTSVEDRNAKLLPGDPTSSAAVSKGAALNNVGGFGEELHGNTDDEIKPEKTLKSMGKGSPAVRSSKPTPIPLSQPNAPSKTVAKPTKSPQAAKSPTKGTATGQPSTAPAKLDKVPTTRSSSMLQPLVPTKALEKKTSRASLASATSSKAASRPTPASAAAASTSEKKASSVKASATSEKKASVASPPSAFHKPRPKSPTKPVKLPSSLTAPTSSSLSKVAAAVAPSSRQSLGAPVKMAARSPSRISLGPKQELRHKPSKLENARPALGPPPSASVRKQPSRQSLPKQVAPTDESFLARMMRPTTASASKTHDKVVTPPRPKPTVSRPTTRDGASHDHKPHEGLKGSPLTNKLPAIPTTATVDETQNSQAARTEILAPLAAEADKPEPIREGESTSKDTPPEDPEIDAISLHEEELSKAPEASPDTAAKLEERAAVVGVDVNDEMPMEEELETVDEVPEPIEARPGARLGAKKPVAPENISMTGDEVPRSTKAEPEDDILVEPQHTSVLIEKSDASESVNKSVAQGGAELEVSMPEEAAAVSEAAVPNGVEHKNEEDGMGVD